MYRYKPYYFSRRSYNFAYSYHPDVVKWNRIYAGTVGALALIPLGPMQGPAAIAAQFSYMNRVNKARGFSISRKNLLAFIIAWMKAGLRQFPKTFLTVLAFYGVVGTVTAMTSAVGGMVAAAVAVAPASMILALIFCRVYNMAIDAVLARGGDPSSLTVSEIDSGVKSVFADQGAMRAIEEECKREATSIDPKSFKREADEAVRDAKMNSQEYKGVLEQIK